MNDNQFAGPFARLPRSPLELLDTVPDSLLRRLKQYSGRLATEAVSAMQERLPCFADLEASQRASVALVVILISAFIVGSYLQIGALAPQPIPSNFH